MASSKSSQDDMRSQQGGNTQQSAQQSAQNVDRGTQSSRDRVQGEGNYEAAREYDEAQRKFVESGKVDAAARAAKPRSEAEEQAMQDAEREGKSRAKEEDPAITKPRRTNLRS